MKVSTTEKPDRWKFIFFVFCALLLVFRLFAVIFTTLNLGPDEAQYWRWSTEFDWGYYSKPPMIAWVIGVETFLFGHAEWAVRFASPVFHLITAIALFDIGRRTWTVKAGVLAGLLYLTMPAIWLSSVIMSTDVPLLAFWSTGLALLFRLREKPSILLGALLGVAIGLGFLSKYAMIYFVLGLAIACTYDRALRQALLSTSGLAALATGLIVLLPHIIWSVATGFKTVGHTADNANWGGSLFHPENGLKFFGDQFGVFGPISFGLLLAFFIIFFLGRTRLATDKGIRVLLAFCLPPLAIILVQAFISRAHANWAGTAYAAAPLLVGVWASQSGKLVNGTLIASFFVNCLAGLIFSFTIVAPPAVVNDMGLANAMKRLRGWPETTRQVADIARDIGATAIITDEREIWHGLDYYGRDGSLTAPLRAWRRKSSPDSYSEEAPISPSEATNALLVNYRPRDKDDQALDFEGMESLGETQIDLGGGKVRTLRFYRVTGLTEAYEPRNK